MKASELKDINVFNKDIIGHKGYIYASKNRLSSVLAQGHYTDATLEIISFADKKVLDVACGDGTYTFEIFDRGQPVSIYGVDLAQEAIKAARQRSGNRRINFIVEDACNLPFKTGSFDIAHLRGALHHADRPLEMLREAFRASTMLVVVESNGYNPILKILEHFSPYHVRHKEKSYLPCILNKWIKELGGTVYTCRYINLVPTFCPDWMARILKIVEPFVERTPFIRNIFCNIYIFVAAHK